MATLKPLLIILVALLSCVNGKRFFKAISNRLRRVDPPVQYVNLDEEVDDVVPVTIELPGNANDVRYNTDDANIPIQVRRCVMTDSCIYISTFA